MSSPSPATTSRSRSVLRAAFQVFGFLVGLSLLAWCASIAMRPENREQLDRLATAGWRPIALLVGLSAASLVLNGMIFWAVLLPARRLRATDVVATNALATFLAYLPFKISLIVRALIHQRRDGVPIVLLGAWMTAFVVAVTAVVGPLIAVSAWRERIDAAWFAAAAAAVAAVVIAGVATARQFAGERGLARLHRLTDPVPLPLLHTFLRSATFAHLHAGFAMLGDPTTALVWTVLRLADVGVQAARFAVAAAVVGVPLGHDEALLFSLTYFLIGAASPSGMLGTREGGTTALAALMAVASSESFAVVALVVTVTESVVNLTGAALAIAWLRPDRLLRLTAPTARPVPPAPPPSPPPPPPD